MVHCNDVYSIEIIRLETVLTYATANWYYVKQVRVNVYHKNSLNAKNG